MKQIHARGELSELLRTVLAESCDLLDADASSLFLYDAERDDLHFAVVVGGREDLVNRRLPVGDGLVGVAARERRSLVVNDVSADPRFMPIAEDYAVHNLLVAPMVRQGDLIGVVEVLNKHQGDFDELDLQILEILAEQAAAHIEHTRLMRAKLEAERRAALGNVAAGLAHYINNVLGQWKGSATLIDVGLERGDIELIKGAWPLLCRSHERITLLVQDMLELSKPREPEHAMIDLAELAQHVVDAEAERAARLGVDLCLESEEVGPAWVDRVRVYELVTNLVTNALDALEDQGNGGGRVRVRVGPVADGGAVRLEVTDDGPGIPPRARGRIFDPFFSTKGSRGTGLGLSLVAKTVEEHHGSVQVDSADGGGTTVEIRLPLAPPAREEPSDPG